MLSEEQMHGYELMKRMEEYTEGHWIPSHSLLYTTLSDLESSGLVTGEKDFKGEVERTIYSITNEGKIHLDEELSQMARMISRMMTTMNEHQIPRLPKLLLDHLPPEERREMLTKFRDRLKKTLNEIEKELAKVK
ncbi:MAG: PadR family transcriptional regulator [Candidatus Thorarchaeota archaeon]